MMVEGSINQAFCEVLDIINHLSEDMYDKIPRSFMKILEKNKDINYNVNIDYSQSINDQNLLSDTRAILSLIYRDYICSKEERNRLLELDNKEIEEHERLLAEKYKIDFNKRNEQIKNNTENQNSSKEIQSLTVESKEKWYIRIFNKILKIFKLQK